MNTDSGNSTLLRKNIVLLSDGTGNSGGKGNGTNVWRLYNAIHRRVPETPQIAFHDDGVGTEDFKLLKIIGGAFGYGLERNVCELYEHLVLNYRPNDRIYLFGFSRGAFTVRVLAGLIAHCGVIDPSKSNGGMSIDRLRELITEGFMSYREIVKAEIRRKRSKRSSRTAGGGLVHRESSPFRAAHSHQGELTIECLGIWDTVDAVGVPFDEARDVVDRIYPTSYSDAENDIPVKNVFHAISVDDQRRTFVPVMWLESTTAGKPRGNVEQVWFPGVHSNVGGGYPKQGVAHVTLEWMAERAQRAGLILREGALEEIRDAANADDKVYDSRSGIAAYYRYEQRDIAGISSEAGIARPKIHVSVLERALHGTDGYSPGNLPKEFDVVATHDDERSKAKCEKLKRAFDETVGKQDRLIEQTLRLDAARRGLHGIFVCCSLVLVGIVMAVIGGWREPLNPTWAVAAVAVAATVMFILRSRIRQRLYKIQEDAWVPFRRHHGTLNPAWGISQEHRLNEVDSN